MIARAPLQLFQAVSTSLLPHLTRLRAEGEEEDFRASVRVTILAIAGFAALVGVAMLIAGPELMQIAFGDKFSYDRADLLIVTAGMGLYLSAATLNQAALAQGQVRRAAAAGSDARSPSSSGPPCRWSMTSSSGSRSATSAPRRVLCALLYVLYRRPVVRRASGPARPRSWSCSWPPPTRAA